MNEDGSFDYTWETKELVRSIPTAWYLEYSKKVPKESVEWIKSTVRKIRKLPGMIDFRGSLKHLADIRSRLTHGRIYSECFYSYEDNRDLLKMVEEYAGKPVEGRKEMESVYTEGRSPRHRLFVTPSFETRFGILSYLAEVCAWQHPDEKPLIDGVIRIERSHDVLQELVLEWVDAMIVDSVMWLFWECSPARNYGWDDMIKCDTDYLANLSRDVLIRQRKFL
jgi:hypothetical protein